MPITINIPEQLESILRAGCADLDQLAREALALEGYRSGVMSVGQVAEMLGMGVIEAQGWLSARGVPLNYTLEDLHADEESLARSFPEMRR